MLDFKNITSIYIEKVETIIKYMHIGLLKELGPKLIKYLLSGIAATFILIIIVGITTRYCHYNDNSFALIKYGYSLYKEDLIDEINWTRVGDKFMVKNSDYADFKVGYNQSEFLDNLDSNKNKIGEGLNTNRIRVQLLEGFIRIKYKIVD